MNLLINYQKQLNLQICTKFRLVYYNILMSTSGQLVIIRNVLVDGKVFTRRCQSAQ